MKLRALIVTSLMLSSAHPAQASGAWIEVRGGAWVPDDTTLSSVSSGIRTYAETMAKRQKRELRPWSEYSFQYQGRTTKGKRFLYVLALCGTLGEPDLHAEFEEVLDGGSCYFRLTFDTERQRFENFRFNAVR
jgi:hypothetical protein